MVPCRCLAARKAPTALGQRPHKHRRHLLLVRARRTPGSGPSLRQVALAPLLLRTRAASDAVCLRHRQALRHPQPVRRALHTGSFNHAGGPPSRLHPLVSSLIKAVGRGAGGRGPHPARCISEQEFDNRLGAAMVQKNPGRDSALKFMDELEVDEDTMRLAETSLVSCGPGSSPVRQISGQTQYQRPEMDAALRQLSPQTRFVVLTGRPDSGNSMSVPDAVLAERRRVSCAGAQLHADCWLLAGLLARMAP